MKMINAVEVKPAFEFYDLITDRYYKIYADGRVIGGAIGQIINRIPHEAYKHQEIKMTREEAIEKVSAIVGRPLGRGNVVDALEALGLIKFDEPKALRKLCSAEQQDTFNFRIEEWPEGYVLWSDGIVVWKSWEYFK